MALTKRSIDAEVNDVLRCQQVRGRVRAQSALALRLAELQSHEALAFLEALSEHQQELLAHGVRAIGERVGDLLGPLRLAEAIGQLRVGGVIGEGRLYSQELLALRERMYDALETQLNALARDLELLDRFLVRQLAKPAVSEE